MQDRESLSINSSDTSISRSRQLESAVPPSKISSLSSGEFVGMTADNPDCRIELKTFHCEIINDHEKIKKETASYKEIPIIRTIDNVIIQKNYLQIKIEIQEIIHSEMERIIKSPALSSLVLKKEK
ncbi:hypothetical protein D3C84_829730 [compost metagenome]